MSFISEADEEPEADSVQEETLESKDTKILETAVHQSTGYIRFQTLSGENILEHGTSGQNLTIEKYKEEVHKLQYIFKSVDFHHQIDYTNLDCIISELTFQDTVKQIEQKCPLMYSLFLEFARADEERKIKTAADKLLRIVHAHSCLIHIGGQRSSVFPHMLGVLLVSFGCGDGEYMSFFFCLSSHAIFIWLIITFLFPL